MGEINLREEIKELKERIEKIENWKKRILKENEHIIVEGMINSLDKRVDDFFVVKMKEFEERLKKLENQQK